MRAQETDDPERKTKSDKAGAIKPANLFGFSKKIKWNCTVCELLERKLLGRLQLTERQMWRSVQLGGLISELYIPFEKQEFSLKYQYNFTPKM